jgi:hypothetical protein
MVRGQLGVELCLPGFAEPEDLREVAVELNS